MGLITVAELLARPGFEDLDSGQADAIIADASAIVREVATPELDDVESPATPPAVVAVVVNMIRRGLRNPMGNTQETLGDYSYAGNPASLMPTRREVRLIRRAAGKLGASSLTMTSDLPLQESEPPTSAEASGL
jgi:hypothetical protein